MTKYDFVLFSGQHKDFLERLQELGLVDVTAAGWEPSDAERGVIAGIEQHKKALAMCKELKINFPEMVEKAQPFAGGDEAFANYAEASRLSESLEVQMARAQKEAEELQIWGDFSPESLDQLSAGGVELHYFYVYSKEFDTHADKWREQFIVEAIGQSDGMTYFVVVTEGGVNIDINAMEMKAPSMNAAQKQAQIDSLNKELESMHATLLRCARSEELIAGSAARMQEELQLSRVVSTSTVEADGSLVVLEGWATQETAAKVEQMLESYPNMIYLKSKPTPEDNTPVKLKNNSFARIFEFIGNFYALPKYGSMDLTPYFAPFYMLFFGFCLADAGYGLVLLAGGTFLLFKGGESVKGVAKLSILCAIATIGFGFWAGSFFGIQLAKQSMFVGIEGFFLNSDRLFKLAIGVGVFQILFGMILKIITTTQQFGFRYALSTLGWLIVLVSSGLAYGLPTMGITSFSMQSTAYMVIAGIGLVMMLTLNNPKQNLLLNIGSGLWNTYNDVTGLLGDVLSYIRLFAIGLSGGILAMVFNDLAMGLSPDIPVVKQIVVVLILLIGHGINLFMSSLSSFVHPMRLTFVEFYKNAGFDAGQRAFEPLKKENK